MNSTKKVTIAINSLNSCNFEDGKKINLIKSICKYFDYTCHVYVDDEDSLNESSTIGRDEDDEDFGMTDIEIECCYDDVEKLVDILKDFDIYIDDVDDCIYQY